MIAARTLLALPLFAAPSLAQAQSSDPSRVRLEGVVVPTAPAGASDTFTNGINFDLSVSEDESKASAQIGGYRVRDTYVGDGSGQTSMAWSIKLSLPIGGADDVTSRSTLDALSDGTKLSASLSLFGFKDAAPRLAQDPFYSTYMSRARALCEARIEAASAAIDAAAEAAIQDCRTAGPDPDFVRENDGATDLEIARALFSGMWRAGVEGAVATDRFEHFTPVTLAEQDSTEFEFEAGVFGAYYFADTRGAMIFRLGYQNGFEDADPVIICKPVVVDPGTDCVKGSPAKPAHVERLNLAADYRRTFDLGRGGAALGIAPNVTVDVLSGEWEAEFPVYYIPKTTSPISPGASVGYSSEKDDVDFRIFMRASFAFE